MHCLICDKSFMTFLPFGMTPESLRANAQCPNCGSLERTRTYWKYIDSVPDFLSLKLKVLHVAPEGGLFRKFKGLPNIEYFPLDKFEEGYKYPKGTLNGDITDLDFPESFFDFILCSHVLEHISQDKVAIKELFRVLKSGGWGILQVPIDQTLEETYEDPNVILPEERIKAFGQFDHVRLYGKDYELRLREAGFEVSIDKYASRLPTIEKFRYGLGEGEALYIVKKP